MKRSQEQIRKSVEDMGISPGVSVCWDTRLGWFRYGCVMKILDDAVILVQLMNGKSEVSAVALTVRHDIDDPIMADFHETYGTLVNPVNPHDDR